FGVRSALGLRVARNTGPVLREESHLGRVADAAGGAYYFDTLTDALAREGWRRFQMIEREGGTADALHGGRIAARPDAAWSARLADIARRKLPIVGVSEFAHLDESLPHPLPEPRRAPSGLPV